MKKFPWTPVLVASLILGVVTAFAWLDNWRMNLEIVGGGLLLAAYAALCGRVYYDFAKRDAESLLFRYEREKETRDNAAKIFAADRCLLLMKWAIYASGPALLVAAICWDRKHSGEAFTISYLLLATVALWAASKGFQERG